MKTNQIRKYIGKVTIAFALAFISLIFITGCNKDNDTQVHSEKTYVLVHGAFQGGYAWNFVKSQLEAAGQKVVVVDLPGHGSDRTPPEVVTLNSYRDKVISAINQVSGKIVLVGHSAGGSVVTGVADSIPEKIESLVYIAAAIPQNGQSLQEITMMDPNSQLFPAVIPAANGVTGSIPDDKVFSLFCHDGSEEVRKLLIMNNRPEPLHPQAEKIVLKNSLATSKIPKYYVRTTLDKVATIDIQNKVIEAAGIKNIFTLNSSHCPFLSMPEKVSQILLQVK